MTTRLRRAGVGLAAAVLAVPFLLLPATSASAAACKISPASATLYERAKNVEFDVPSAQYWTLQISDIGLYLYDTDGQSSTIAHFEPKRLSNRDTGAFAVKVQRQNGDAIDSCSAGFRLKRGAELSVSVGKVAQGRKVSGTLRRVNLGSSGGWAKMAGQPVAVQYKNLHGAWVTAKVAKTNKKGRFSATVKLGKHQWRAVYAGNGATGSRTSKSVTR